jgi:hypothetical protein
VRHQTQQECGTLPHSSAKGGAAHAPNEEGNPAEVPTACLSPVSPATRTLAWMEAITGQFYLAVIVAGLVSVLAAKGKPEGVP